MEMNNNINYEDYIGRLVRGFRFEGSDKLGYNPIMDEYIGRVGRIGAYHEEYGTFTVEFDDDFWNYPADLVIKQLEQKEELIKMMEKDEEAGIYNIDDSEIDLVNNPPHYTKGGIECIDAIKASMSSEAFKGFLKGQILKYSWRYESKFNPLEDLKKMMFYGNRLIKELEDER